MNTYRCVHCGKVTEQDSNKSWIKSFCEAVGKDVHLVRFDWPVENEETERIRYLLDVSKNLRDISYYERIDDSEKAMEVLENYANNRAYQALLEVKMNLLSLDEANLSGEDIALFIYDFIDPMIRKIRP